MNSYLIEFTYNYLHLKDQLYYVAPSVDSAKYMFKEQYGDDCIIDNVIYAGPATLLH